MRIAKGLEPLLKRIALRSVRRRGNSLQPPFDSSSVKRIMIYRPERFGDMLATLPVIRAIKTQLPGAEIHVWTSPQGQELLAPEPTVDHIELVTGKSVDRTLAKKTKSFDLVFDMRMRDSVNSLLVCDLAARDGVLVGWGKGHLRGYYDWAPDLHDTDEYALYQGLGVLAILGIDRPAAPDVLPAFTPSETQAMAHFLNAAPKPVVVNLSAGDLGRKILEPVWRVVVKSLTQDTDAHVVLNCVDSDRDLADRLAQGRAIPTAKGMTFREAACLVSQASLFISPDTSLVHIAAAAGVPTLAFYLPRTDFRMTWVPPFEHVLAITSPDASLKNLSADTILAAMESPQLAQGRKVAT